jgi:cytochrome c oxidase assembly protein subunit 15
MPGWVVQIGLIAMGHLLGGFAVLSCLFLLYLRLTSYRIPGGDAQIRPYAKFGALGIAIVVWQIALVGWNSANYALNWCNYYFYLLMLVSYYSVHACFFRFS